MSSNEFDHTNVTLAHPGKRYQGQFIDGVISIIMFAILVYVKKKAGIENDFFSVMTIAIPFAYFVLSDALPNGQSVGKRVLSMSVINKATGKPCSIFESIVRNILTPILGVIDAILILGKKRQRLGDKMANTIVINLKKNKI